MKNDVSRAKVNIRWSLISVVILFLIASSYSFSGYYNKAATWVSSKAGIDLPLYNENSSFTFGLDVEGGVELVYEADTKNVPTVDKSRAVEGVRDIIERRVNSLGVSEALVQTNKSGDAHRIIVQIPGVIDVKKAQQTIGETPILDFREQNDEPPRELTKEEQKRIDTHNADAKKRANDLLARVRRNEDFGSLVTSVSEDTLTKFKGGDLGFLTVKDPRTELYTWAKTRAVGEISKTLIETTEGWNILKINEKRDGEPEVSARHILVCYAGAQGCASTLSKEDALAKIQNIQTQATKENFAALARQFSDDTGSRDNGGSLGFFGKGLMTPAFETAAYALTKGQISEVVETPFGFHLILKEDQKSDIEVGVSRILIKKLTKEEVVPTPSPWKPTGLTGKYLKNASVVFDQYTGAAQILVLFNNEGKTMFAEITKRNLQKPLAIFLDGEPISAPIVQSEITQGEATISGDFTPEDARILAQRLNAGALPIPVTLVAQETIGASLGYDSLQKSLKAGLIGAALLALFMTLYYRLPGFLAAMALVVYSALVLAIFKFIPVTLTLAGIAGFLMSLGIAVDANVLIFERSKEELRQGKSIGTAIHEGFERAWSSIRDSNVSSLISCVLLYWFGTSTVRGFAVTLAIGVVVSLFSAIVVTRLLVRTVEPLITGRFEWLMLGGGKK